MPFTWKVDPPACQIYTYTNGCAEILLQFLDLGNVRSVDTPAFFVLHCTLPQRTYNGFTYSEVGDATLYVFPVRCVKSWRRKMELEDGKT